MGKNRESRNKPCTYDQLIYNKGGKNIQKGDPAIHHNVDES